MVSREQVDGVGKTIRVLSELRYPKKMSMVSIICHRERTFCFTPHFAAVNHSREMKRSSISNLNSEQHFEVRMRAEQIRLTASLLNTGFTFFPTYVHTHNALFPAGLTESTEPPNVPTSFQTFEKSSNSHRKDKQYLPTQ